MKKIIVSAAVLAAVLVNSAFAAKEMAEISLSDNYVIVSGNGAMKDFSNSEPSEFTLNPVNVNFVNVMNGVTSVGDNAFRDCVNIGDIIIPSSVTSIGSQAFAGCENLKEVTIPHGVKEIEKYAFINCPNLEKVYIPDSVVKYGESCFYGCPKLTIYASDKSCMRSYAEADGVNFVATDGEQNTQVDVLDTVRILINGTELTYKYPVVMKNSMTFIPLRTIFEAVGCTVGWDGNAKCATVTKDGVRYDFYIGSAEIFANGVRDTLSMPTSLICGNTMVHIRAVEKLGMSVSWDGESQTISITY